MNRGLVAFQGTLVPEDAFAASHIASDCRVLFRMPAVARSAIWINTKGQEGCVLTLAGVCPQIFFGTVDI